VTLHNRLDPGLFDEMAQPDQHGHAKDRGEADPSRLRNHKVKIQASISRQQQKKKCSTNRDVPWHVVLARERGRISALRDVHDAHERPHGGENRVREGVVAEDAREPPKVARRVLRDARGVRQEEEEGGRGPDLERHFEVCDLRRFDL